jgi:hypothetical protein
MHAQHHAILYQLQGAAACCSPCQTIACQSIRRPLAISLTTCQEAVIRVCEDVAQLGSNGGVLTKQPAGGGQSIRGVHRM